MSSRVINCVRVVSGESLRLASVVRPTWLPTSPNVAYFVLGLTEAAQSKPLRQSPHGFGLLLVDARRDGPLQRLDILYFKFI